MTRRFRGRFRPVGPQTHPELVLASRPIIAITMMLGRRHEQVRFMIDTGADLSIVSPTATERLFGDEFDFNSIPASRRLPMAGIGPGMVDTVIQRVGLLMTDEDGAGFRFPQTMLFAVPQPGVAGRWRVPSVLGRDVLRRFELRLSYDPPTALLILND